MGLRTEEREGSVGEYDMGFKQCNGSRGCIGNGAKPLCKTRFVVEISQSASRTMTEDGCHGRLRISKMIRYQSDRVSWGVVGDQGSPGSGGFGDRGEKKHATWARRPSRLKASI